MGTRIPGVDFRFQFVLITSLEQTRAHENQRNGLSLSKREWAWFKERTVLNNTELEQTVHSIDKGYGQKLNWDNLKFAPSRTEA